MTETLFNIILSIFFCIPIMLWSILMVLENKINKRIEKLEREYDRLRCEKFEEAIKIMKET